ncbi:MAG: hypothetical protein JNG49_08435 [Peptostreptococcus stomatis]|nr:hypothetical protein [Peptostreptococcus stomatis]MBL6466426.1 hypothetical protein [Peptostreptococcus stomatis]
MLIKQEIQAIQDSDYKFTVEHTPTGWLVIIKLLQIACNYMDEGVSA